MVDVSASEKLRIVVNHSRSAITVNRDNTNAVSILPSTSSTVSGNTLRATNTDNSLGVQMGIYSHNGVIENNTITTPTNFGIWIYDSNDVTARNNTITGRGDSGVLASGNNTTISGNTP